MCVFILMSVCMDQIVGFMHGCVGKHAAGGDMLKERGGKMFCSVWASHSIFSHLIPIHFPFRLEQSLSCLFMKNAQLALAGDRRPH